MEPTTHVTREYLIERKLISTEDLNLSAIRSLMDYVNQFGTIDFLKDYLDQTDPTPVFQQMYSRKVDSLKKHKAERGIIVETFDPELIFTPEEITDMQPDILDRMYRILPLVDEINSLEIGETDLLLMVGNWQEISQIIRAPYDGYQATWDH